MLILLERDSELAVLDEALDRARGGSGALVVVEGPAGIGKSRLLEAAAQHARERGLRCLRGRGAELEREMAFGVARQVLGPSLRALDADERERVTGGLAAGAASLLTRVPPIPSDQGALVDALYWLVYELGWLREDARGALLVVDDAQWSDASSLRVLVRLAVGLDELAVALVVAVRSGEHVPDDLLGRLRAHPDCRFLRPAVLSEHAVGALVRDQLGEHAAPELCRACTEATGGNPFLVSELVASLRADGVAPSAQAAARLSGMVPESVLHSVLLRLARLPRAARRLAEAAAVVGPDAPLRLARAVADLPADRAEPAADALVAAGILRSPDPLLFAHPLIADAVASDLPQLARARAHRRAAERLAAEGGPNERIAAHLHLTMPAGDAWVVDVLRAAAGESMARGEALGAARLLERALAEPPLAEERAELVCDLAVAEAASGSKRALERLADVRAHGADPHHRARTLQAMSRLLFARGEVLAAIQAAEQGRAELEPDDQLAGRILASQVANMFFLPGAWAENERLLAELEQGLESGRWAPEPLLLAQLSTRRGVWLGEGPERVRPLAEAMLRTAPDQSEVWQGDPSLAAALVFVGEVELAERVLARMEEHARRTQSPIYASMTACWRSALRLQQGWVTDAATDAQRVLDGTTLGWTSETGWGASTLAAARLELDDLEGARVAIAAGMRGDRARLPHGFVLHAGGEVALASGEPEAALRDFRAAGAHLSERYALDNPAVMPWRAGALRALVALGERAQAATMAAAQLEAARSTRTPHAVGVALRAAATAAGGDEQRAALLREAVDVLAPSGAQLEHARALCDLGAVLRHARKTRPARESLNRAGELACRLGATATARRAHRELRLSGARPGRRAGGDEAASLTPAERRVAELAAQDHSNAQIARLLFVTPRTVEWHLTQTYRKLGIRSRAGLAQALDRLTDDA